MKTLIALLLLGVSPWTYAFNGINSVPYYVIPGWNGAYHAGLVRARAAQAAACPLLKAEAAMRKQFPTCMNYNFALPKINTTFAGLTDLELARLTHQYYIEAGGTIAPLAKIAAQHLTAANLVRFASAAGQAATAQAVSSYAPVTVSAAFHSSGVKAAIPRSLAQYQSVGVSGLVPAAPSLNMTAMEVYLEYRTSVEAFSVTEALFLTARFCSVQLGSAATGGYYVGKSLLWVGDQINPNFSASLANELGGLIYAVTEIDIPVVDGNYLANYDGGGCGCSVTVETWNMMDVEL